MVSITISDIQEVYGEQEPTLSSTKKTTLKDTAENLTEDVFSGRLMTLAEVEGDESDFTAYLGAHLWEIAEGGEASSQSQTGGSINFDQNSASEIRNTLTETRYGRVALMYLRQNDSVSIVRTDF